MKLSLAWTIILPILSNCQQLPAPTSHSAPAFNQENPFRKVKDIPLPTGHSRVLLQPGSFGKWLEEIEMKKSRTVYLFNGQPKLNQSAQFAVLNISVGNRDLQQCADAIMRLRAEWLFSQKRFSEIKFQDNNLKEYCYDGGNDRNKFLHYLENVFAHCGTLSLSRQLHRINSSNIQAGDVLIRGGSPGHAVMVVDVAINDSGKKIFLLAQSYMPAQDIHILRNPMNDSLSPWYEINNDPVIATPEWTFTIDQFSTW